jgi:hypothetical protein
MNQPLSIRYELSASRIQMPLTSNTSSEKPGKIPNSKYQIPNKSQILIFNDQSGAAMPYCNLRGSTLTPEPQALNP